jgi:ribosomal protein S18 acetylase RimI-like enzyme
MIGATRVRWLEPADLDRVVGIDAAPTGRSRRGFYVQRMRAREERAIVALAAERGGVLVGFAFAHVLDGEFGGEGPVGVLDAMAVAPAARGDGVATALLADLEAALAARGARELRTQSDWSDQAMTGFFASAGFRISGRLVLERALDVSGEEDLPWEELPVRSMSEADLAAIVRLDRKITGRDRAAYYARKAVEALQHSGVRVSLVAELDRQFAGFLMARVDFGEFGRTEPTAVLDTVGVDPAFRGRRVGRALLEQLVLNLRSLRVERLLTEVGWDDRDLLAFFGRTGFGHSQRLSFTKAIG